MLVGPGVSNKLDRLNACPTAPVCPDSNIKQRKKERIVLRPGRKLVQLLAK
jgi:hypothetical protein